MLTFPTVEGAPAFPAQAVLDATDLRALAASAADTGVVSGCAVSPHSSGADLHVAVAAGTILVAGTSVSVSGSTDVTVTAASSHDRRDIVVSDASGVLSVVAGTPCTVAAWTSVSGQLPPVKPDIPSSSVLLAEVYVPGAATSITAANIVDKRPAVPATHAAGLWVPVTGPTADLPFNGHKATGLADPASAQDAATKAYVDAFNQGFDLKASVRAASNTNHTLVSPGATVDGVTLVAGDRVLLRAQTSAAENGIYVWNGATSAMTRAADADTSAKITSGLYTFATEGTAWGSTGFGLITADPIVLGTTALTFSPVSGVGEVTAGTGLTKTGNTIAVSDAELLALAGLVSAADKLPYFTGSGAAALATLSSFIRTLLDDADAATAQATLGLGTAATHAAGDFDTSGAASTALATATGRALVFALIFGD